LQEHLNEDRDRFLFQEQEKWKVFLNKLQTVNKKKTPPFILLIGLRGFGHAEHHRGLSDFRTKTACYAVSEPVQEYKPAPFEIKLHECRSQECLGS